MQKITTTTTADPILAIDLGKYKSLAEAVRFASITTSRA